MKILLSRAFTVNVSILVAHACNDAMMQCAVENAVRCVRWETETTVRTCFSFIRHV